VAAGTTFALDLNGYWGETNRRRQSMGSLTDKVTGKAKQVAGDLTGDSSTRHEGIDEERKGEKKDQLANAEEKADQKAEEVADLERETS
jgi:uncharacterized protein YjbJ (UPF0337 family)